MLRRSTWILIAIFLSLSAVLLFYERVGNGVSTQEIIETAELDQVSDLIYMFEIPMSRVVVSLEIEDVDGNLILMKKSSEVDDWRLLEPNSDTPDSERIQDAIERVLAVRVEGKLEQGIDPDVIGLKSPVHTITLTLDDGTQLPGYIGNLAITQASYYVRVGLGEPMLVSRYGIDACLDLLAAPPIQATIAPSEPLNGTSEP